MVLNQIALLFTHPLDFFDHFDPWSELQATISSFEYFLCSSFDCNQLKLVRHFRIDRHFRGAFEAFGGIWRHMALWKMEFSKLINLHIPFEKVLLSLTPPFRSWLWIQSSFLMKGLKRLKTSSGFRSAKLRTYEKTHSNSASERLIGSSKLELLSDLKPKWQAIIVQHQWLLSIRTWCLRLKSGNTRRLIGSRL